MRCCAYVLYARAAAQGHAKSLNMLGRFHEEGWDRQQDVALAASYYAMPAAAGSPDFLLQAGDILHQRGPGVAGAGWAAQPDQFLPSSWYRRAGQFCG